jgi:tetratricopeptide (TPR) repeat protein
MYRIERDLDPSDALREAGADLDTALEINPQIFWAYPEKTAVELLAARWAMKSGTSPQSHFEAASESAARALTVNPRNAVAYQSAAEVHRWRADDRLRQGLSIRSDVNQGRRLVEQALALNPGLASAMVTGAALTTIQAEAETSQTTRIALAADAEDAVRRALEINPFLERETEDLRRRIRAVSH